MISVLLLAADPSDAARLRLGEEVREIQERLQLSRARDQFILHQRWSVRPMDISQALLDTNPRIVHFSGHGTRTGALYVEDRVGQLHPIRPEALEALFEIFASEVDCVILNACYSETQARALGKHIRYVIGMNQAIGDEAAIAFSVGFYQALGAGRTIEDAYKLGCVQIALENIPEHLTPVLVEGGLAADVHPRSVSQPAVQRPGATRLAVKPPAVARPCNLGFEVFDGDQPSGWFNSLGFVDFASTAYEASVVARPGGGTGMSVRFQNPRASEGEFGSLMQRCPAGHLAGRVVRFEGEVTTRGIERWAGLWLRADGDRELNLYFDNMSDRPIRGSTSWGQYRIEALLPEKTTWLNYGIVLEGRGTMWADNFRLMVWTGEKWVDV